MIKPEWLILAYNELARGVFEVEGNGDNPRILEYHSCTTLKASEDDVPWCSSFLCWIFEKSGYQSTGSAAAKSWLEWGESLDTPKEGCIAVLSRGSKDGTSGHVGIYINETPNHVMILGGNQSNKVCVQAYPKEQVIGYRWPNE